MSEMQARQERLLFYRMADKSINKEAYDKGRILNLLGELSVTPQQVNNALYVCGVIGENNIKKYMEELVMEELLIKHEDGSFSRNF